jgi:fructose/tagatose bisphosphate aldolase
VPSIALHGGTGLSDDQFHRCIGLGCAKVNISTMHKRLFIEGFVGLRAEKPKLEEPLPFISAQHAALKADVMQCIRTFGLAGRAGEVAHAA